MAFINRKRKFHAVGVDVFVPYIQQCRKLGAHESLILADVRKQPFQPKSFDTVICMEVLEHMAKEEGKMMLQCFEKIARKQVILTTPVGKYKQGPYDGNPYLVFTDYIS